MLDSRALRSDRKGMSYLKDVLGPHAPSTMTRETFLLSKSLPQKLSRLGEEKFRAMHRRITQGRKQKA